MDNNNERIQKRMIEDEMKQSYVDYAMSVIVGRALPDIRDGLKPVHRRILFSMKELGLYSNKQFKKCARVVGDCLGKFHPHGDLSVYDALVRMAQEFSLRYPLIKGQGNFGSTEDKPASMRYTECKLNKIAEEILQDLDKDTVDFTDNFDGSLKEPLVLPCKVPNLLINGSSGIAVGMATNIPPHNLKEICEAAIKVIDNPDVSVEELMEYVKGPDFPTGGVICGRDGVFKAYKTGRGKLLLRGVVDVEEKRLIVREIPYQVNKALMIEHIVDLVKDKRIEGIRDIRDESNKEGIRVVIELKQNVNPELVLNKLYKYTSLQTTFGIINLSLVNNEPKILGLKETLNYFVLHRKEVVTRRTKFELKKASERAHILEGLKVALENIDDVINLIKKSKDASVAREGLINKYKLSEIQAQAILDMRLQKLTSLETSKINQEYSELVKLIAKLKAILDDEKEIYKIIKNELNEIVSKYSDERRTRFDESFEELEVEDLIKKEDVVVTISNDGYVKRLPLDTYKEQKRGGRGVKGADLKENDFIKYLFVANTHSYLLCFSNKGKVYWLKTYAVPSAGRYSRGTNFINLLRLDSGEKISSVISVKNFGEGYLLMATAKGLLKKTKLVEYSRPRQGGIIAVKLKAGDELVNVRLTSGEDELILATANGYAVRFNERLVRSVGRNASGVKGVRLLKDKVVGMEFAKGSLLTITENGFGKRSKVEAYRLVNRGAKGVINIKTSSRNGRVVGIRSVLDDDQVIFISKKGIVIRVNVGNISLIGRNTQGVKLMKLGVGDKVVSIAKVENGE